MQTQTIEFAVETKKVQYRRWASQYYYSRKPILRADLSSSIKISPGNPANRFYQTKGRMVLLL